MNLRIVAAAMALAAAVVVALDVFGADLPPWAAPVAASVSGFSLLIRSYWFRGTASLSGGRLTRAAYDSDGWRKDTFVMDGLEEEGEALRESTEDAAAHGYRREATNDRYAWRFIRETSPQ